MDSVPPVFAIDDGIVYPRHYRVPIALDVVSQRPILPAEATRHVGDRYQCYGCGQFVHVVTQANGAERPRETWFFAHAKHEARKCRGEGIDHVMASAAVTWLLTRHLTGATTLIIEHRCGRCRGIVPFEVPRDGLSPSINHQYQGTSRFSDVALVDQTAVPAWAIEIRKSHEVNVAKAKEIPCAWAEIAASDLLDLLKDSERRYQKRIVLQALQGRPAEPLPRPSGSWHCADCCALPPLPEIPIDADPRNLKHRDLKAHETARLRAIRILADKLRQTAYAGSLHVMLPDRCDRHDVPLVLTLDERLRAAHIATPAPSPKLFQWDVTLNTWAAGDPEYRMKPLGILVVGSHSHPTVESGTYAPPATIPFLMIDMATVGDVNARARMAVNVTLPRWCPLCRREDVARAMAQRSSQERIHAYMQASEDLWDELEVITDRAGDYIASHADWESRLHGEVDRYRHGVFLRLMTAAGALQDMDFEWFNDNWHNCQEETPGVPNEDLIPVRDGGASLRKQFSPEKVQSDLRKRIEEIRSTEIDQAARMDRYDRAASACAKTRRTLTDLARLRDPDCLKEAQRLIEEFITQVDQVLRAADNLGPFVDIIGRGGIPLNDPITGKRGDPSAIIGGRENLESHIGRRAFIAEVTTAIDATRRKLAADEHRTQARVAMEQARMLRATISCAGCGSLAEFETRLDGIAKQISDLADAARSHLTAITDHPSGLFDRAAELAEADRISAGATRHALLNAHPSILRQIEIIEKDRVAREQARDRLGSATKAFAALCDHLAGLPRDAEWDVIGAPLPGAALTALRMIAEADRPRWARDAIQVMAAGVLTMTPEVKRQRLLEIRNSAG